MTTKHKWYMLTLVGKDRPGIVAHVTAALYEGGANLGETSMMRLGGNFSIMMMVQFSGNTHALQETVGGVAESLGLQLHIDHIEGHGIMIMVSRTYVSRFTAPIAPGLWPR